LCCLCIRAVPAYLWGTTTKGKRAVPFAELDVLEPAKDYKNRHASILLAFDATLEAIEAAKATT